MSKLRDMKKRFLPLSMLLITIVLAQASIVANATEKQGQYVPRSNSKATISSFMKSIRANQETGLIDPALLIAGQKAAQTSSRDASLTWNYAGPDNFGGLTKAVIYNNDGTVLIGTMGGELYKTTNGGVTFQRITNLSLPISCMVKTSAGDIFIGTGDGRDAHLLNGLSDIGYETGFIGKGIYKMAAGSTTPELLVSTTPTATNGWGYVNELTITNNKIYAATAAGVMVSEDNGESWNNVQEGNFRSIRANNNGDILAADTANVFLSKAGGAFTMITGTAQLPSSDLPKVIAMSENNANFMYIAYYIYNASIKSYSIGNIYYTDNNAESWNIALAGSNLYQIFGTNEKPGDFNGYMIVYPDNPRRLLMGASDLWEVKDVTGQGVNSYRPVRVSENFASEYSSNYIHKGIHAVAFNPTNAGIFFVGTNGGIFKGVYSQSRYTFTGGNRYFITDDVHCSPARMMSVGVGGTTMTLGGCLDHGTLVMSGSENLNNVTTGETAFPHPTNNGYASSYFDVNFAGGPCAISTIDPSIYFVSATGGLSTPIYRTQTLGVDYDPNFEGNKGPVIRNKNAFKTPYAFWETYNDDHHSFDITKILDSYNYPLDTLAVIDTIFINDTVYVTGGAIYVVIDTLPTPQMHNPYTLNDTLYKVDGNELYIFNILHNYPITETINLDTLILPIRNAAKAGDEVVYYSKQGNYPIFYTLPEPPHDPAHVDTAGGYMWIVGDTITGLHDPLKTNYIVAVEDTIWMTRDALIFDKPTDWFPISKISGGIPTAVAISSDGTTAYVGTVEGKFYKITNINDAFSAEQADINDTVNICVAMTADETTFAGRAITSIYVNPSNNNEVLVTLGNYGNTDYVYVSQNAGTSFTALSGLPQVPVYSGLIEKATGLYIVGTEIGIYTSENGSTWTKSGDVSCPIMDLKQAYMDNHDDVVIVLFDEIGTPLDIVYPGISNEGMIYAASYGAGILSCGTYKEGGDLGVEENEMAVEDHVQLNVYPNPVMGNARMNITLNEGAAVSYQVFDMSGRMVVDNKLGYYPQGTHTVTFNAADLTSGSYIIRLQAGGNTKTGKFLVY